MLPEEKIPWAEKYRVNSYEDVKGHNFPLEKVKMFIKTFPRKKSLILHGSPGVGKTSLAYAIALENDAEILELNASDLRDKKKIAEVVGPAVGQKSLFRTSKLILVDEIDGISATKDRGGLAELLGLIEKSPFPVILTANNIWDKKFNLLRKKSETVEMKDLDYKVIMQILYSISRKENLPVNDDMVKSISIKSRGDVRAALNDLQLLSGMGPDSFKKLIVERNKEHSIFTALQYVFKRSKIDADMLGVYDEVNMPIDDIFLWIEENIPIEYKNEEELAHAFEALSYADVFRGRIYRQQYWRFMVYEFFLLGAGIASSKKTDRSGFTSYKKPSRILKIWLNNQRIAKKKSICAKYARFCHISTKKAMREFMLVRIILKDDRIRKQLELEEDEIAYLDKPVKA